MFAAKYQLKRAALTARHSTVHAALWTDRKGKSSNKQCFYRNNKTFRGIKSYNTCSNTAFGIDIAPQSFCRSFIALLMIRCSKSAQKFAVQVCQVAAVVVETTQLVLSRLKTFCRSHGE